MVTACRPLPGNYVKRLLSYEVASSTEWQCPNSAPPFVPNYYVDISNQLDRKIHALEAYEQEMREWPHARSIEAIKAMTRYRGSQVGVNAAEAFILLRHVS